MHDHRDPRTDTAPEEIVAAVRECVDRIGIAGAIRETGVSRTVVLAALARQPIMRGSLALLREYVGRLAA